MSRALKIIGVIVAIISLALFFMPLRLAISMAGIEDKGFSAQSISGSIWAGRIEQVTLGGFALGDLEVGAQFFPLLSGSAKLDLERPAGSVDFPLTATIGKRGKSLMIENVSAALSVGQKLAPLPASNIELDGVSVEFNDGRCQSASGKVRFTLDRNIPGLDLKQGLLGNAICNDGILEVPLASASAMEQLTLKVDESGTYSTRLFLSGENRGWAMLLPAMGFSKVPNGYAMIVSGSMAQ